VLPIAAVVWQSRAGGVSTFWSVVSDAEAVSALELSIVSALAVAGINAVAGTVIAWVLVRDDFRGRSLVNAIIDLPFALPTIVAGLTLIALYGPRSPVGIDVTGTRTAVALALLFVTLPFVVRAVQPVLLELDTEMEEAARSLGAGEGTVFRRIVLPNILPGLLKTQVASVFIFLHIQSGDRAGASAVAVVLLAISFAVLLVVGAIRHFATRYERA